MCGLESVLRFQTGGERGRLGPRILPLQQDRVRGLDCAKSCRPGYRARIRLGMRRKMPKYNRGVLRW